MKKDTWILLSTSLLCVLVFSILKVKPFMPTEFITVFLGGFILLAFFSFVFYKFDPSKNYGNAGLVDVFDPTGISIMERLSFWGVTGYKRLAACIIIQVIITLGAYFFMN